MPTTELENFDDSYINLKEIFATLWYYKALIVAIMCFCTIFSGYRSIKAEKVYTAQSVFVINNPDGQSTGISFANFSPLAALSSGQPDYFRSLLERVSSREFILDYSDVLELRQDEFYNPFLNAELSPTGTPSETQKTWKTLLKSKLGIVDDAPDTEAILESMIIKSFKSSVSIVMTPTKAFRVAVKHTSPNRAAEIANLLTDIIIQTTRQEQIDQTNEKIRYLSKSLADASEELLQTENALKQYTLENSTEANKNFTEGSATLLYTKSKRNQTEEQLEAVKSLKNYVIFGKTAPQDYQRLSINFPIIDQPDFRRVLGLSEVIDAWQWPNLETIIQVEDSVEDRLTVLNADVARLEREALKYANSAQQLSLLTREVRLAEATYTVLLEQIKSQTLAAGFQTDNSRILEAATAPLAPSSPNKQLLIVQGIVSGFFVGALLALIFGIKKNVYFANTSLFNAISAPHQHRVKLFRRFKNVDLHTLQERLCKMPLDWARHTLLETTTGARKQVVFVCDLSSDKTAHILGRMIAATAGNLERDVALINLSRFKKASDEDLINSTISELSVIESGSNCIEYAYTNGVRNIDLLFHKSFGSILEKLHSSHQLLIFTSNEDTIDPLVSAQFTQQPFIIAYVKNGRSRKDIIRKIKHRGRIKVLYHG